ncbi:MAG: response regulator [Burkholderiales bacterium]|nr:MAG: response regulator [Burkholderiales bacterium]
MVYALAQYVPVDYSKSFYGQFDPSLLVQARKRIGQLKESWSSFTAGELSKAKPVQDQMALLVDSIAKLLPTTGQGLIAAMNDVMDSTARQQKPPEPALGMEVATAILYIEASFEDFDPEDKQQTNRLEHLAQRVHAARGGADSQPLEAWMEEMYRRVSDRQTMGSVVGELKLILGELEKMMDAYFRDPQDKVLLSEVPGKFMQMRGVLTVLGLDQASQAVSRMRDTVEQLMVTEIDVARARETGTFDRLGNNLGALGFLIDMLSYQPVLAKKLFVYDEAAGELKPLMGRTIAEVPEVAAPAPAQAASFNPDATMPMAVMAAMAAAAASSGAAAPAAAAAAPVIVDAAEVDPELLDIFLEEAREVVSNGLMATLALVAEPNNIGEMTTLRRAFHTLKGSSRMVGLNVFGEAAWSMEQVMNAWLADQKPASQQLCDLSTQALNAHQVWIEEIAKGGGKDRSALPFRNSADALRLQGQFVPIQIPAASSMDALAVATVAMPAVAATSAAAELELPAFDFEAQESAPMQEIAAIAAEPLPELTLPDWDAPEPVAVAAQAAEPAPQVPVDLPEHMALEEAAAVAAADLPPAIDFDDLDLEFDAAFSKADQAPAPDTLTAEPGSVIDLDSPLMEPSAAASMPELDAVEGPAQDALITAEELQAFEQALMAMDDAPAADSAALTAPSSLDVNAQVQAESFEIDSIDLQALQNLAPAPVATSESPIFKATMLQTAPQNLPDFNEQHNDFSGAATVPAMLDMNTQPSSLGDLSIDFGNSVASAPAASSSSLLWGAGAAGLAGAAAAGLSSAAPSLTSASLLSPLSASPAVMPAAGGYATEEQFKAIGPLRVSLPLYNVYLNEADEWSRRLANVLSEWALEPEASIPNDAVAFAHSLAGSSATVGFSALSGLARSFENTLIHMQRIEEDGEYDSHMHSKLFLDAAEDVRHLLHQFAAGILKGSSPQIEAELARCMQAPFATAGGTLTDLDATSEVFIQAEQANVQAEPAPSAPEKVALDAPVAEPVVIRKPELIPEPVVTIVTTEVVKAREEPQKEVVAEPVKEAQPGEAAKAVSPIASVEPVAAVAALMAAPVVAASLTEAPLLAVKNRQIGQDEIDDEIDAVDAIDPDLFEIFEEEAQELFPTTASALRQWTARPDNMSARGEVLRGLHTLKGSARLAGAMRLGELAHRMESSVESIPHEGAQSADIEQLMAQLDGMQHNFDVLRNPALANEPSKSNPAVGTPVTEMAASAAATLTSTSLPAASVKPLQPLAAATGMIAPAAAMRSAPGQTVRVRAQLLDRLMNQAGEVMITRARLEAELSQLRGSLTDLGGNLDKLRTQLRELDVQAESQMQTRLQQTKETEASFDPLEFDRYTRVQELTRMMAESVNDVATVQRNIQRTIESTEDDLVMQARQTRDLQRDLLRTRMVEFEGISERLYRVVRQAGKDAGKQVKLDILGGTIEMDRGVLDRMTPAFEHLLRNCVAHGIETAEARTAAGKAASGEIVITLHQEGNDVSIEFRDDGAGLNIARIREKAISQGLLSNDAALADNDAANLIFTPGFSTAATVTELSGRGVGMDVVRSEVVALGGRIETATSAGQGTSFKLVLPLTTAVTQVVMMRIGELAIGVPANLIEIVRRASLKELQSSYNSGTYEYAGESLPFFWSGALLQHSAASSEPATKTMPVAVFRSAAQRVAVHIDEVLGNQEVVVKNLGPQLSRLPGLAGMTVLASGAVALIYNPVALATVYGAQARAMSFDPAQPHALEGQAQLRDVTDAVPRELSGDAQPVVPLVPANPASISPPSIPLVLVVDDSITVRRVTQRLLQREGYRVSMAADGLQALERLAEELPSVILSDIEMPRMDGFDLLRNVRGDAKLKHLPTIMITSRIAEKHREYAFELGANHYLGKPYNEEELLSLIRRYAREEATV